MRIEIALSAFAMIALSGCKMDEDIEEQLLANDRSKTFSECIHGTNKGPSDCWDYAIQIHPLRGNKP